MGNDSDDRFATTVVAAYRAHLHGVQGLAPATQTAYTSVVAQFARWLPATGRPALERVTVGDIEAWVATLTGRGLAPRTRKLAVAALRSFYAWLPGRDDNPAERVRTPRIPPSDVTPYTPDEIVAMLGEARARSGLCGRVEEAVLTTLRFTGLRVRELVDLEIGAVDLPARRLEVIGKGGRQRTMPLALDLQAHLQQYLATVRPACPGQRWLFASPRSRQGGRWSGRISPTAVRRAVQQCGEAAGLPGKHHPHRWRHTFATDLRDGVDIHLVQRLLGHRSIASTVGYTHLALDDLRRIVEARW